MATGRTVLKNSRFYMDGYDFSGYSRMFGPLSWTFATDEQAALTDGVKNSLLGHATITPTVRLAIRCLSESTSRRIT